MTEDLAKKILYQHFGNRGCFNPNNLPGLETLTDADTDKLFVDFDTMYLLNLNNNKYTDAIITYWLTLIYANGRCLQPHRAIIVDSDNGYKITNEEFIPTNYIIDSVDSFGGQVTIFGYDYECANDKIVRHLRLKIK